MKHFAQMWKKADADQSGRLSKEEFSSLPRVASLPSENLGRLFQRLDKDGNGTIERSEMARPQPQGDDSKKRMKRLWELDANEDRKISLEEFSQGGISQRLPEEGRERLFNRLDTNKDGFISKEDRPKRRGEGRPGMSSERKGERPLQRQGQIDPGRFDSNQDEVLDFSEFSKMPMHQRLDEDQREDLFEKADQNGDQKLSRDEWGSLETKRMFGGKNRSK